MAVHDPWSMEHNLINTYKETPEIPPNNSPQDIVNEIFENVPVSLGKQHFSPKLGFRMSYTVCAIPGFMIHCLWPPVQAFKISCRNTQWRKSTNSWISKRHFPPRTTRQTSRIVFTTDSLLSLSKYYNLIL